MPPPNAPPPEALVEALADRYRIGGVLGEGGMATVYRAQDLKHDRSVAIKVLRPELSAVIGAERFLAEIKTTANLQHPHILALFDSGEAVGLLYYVMPLVDGESLRDRLDREKQLPVDEAVRIGSAVASALDYAHRQGVIHRDIKPANILLHDGEPVVADFGIALAVSAAGGGRLTETGLSLGTPHYMSPEQATADRELSAQSDIYALASVTYEMLTGAAPFAAPTAQGVLMKILTEDAPPVTTLRKSVPAHVEAALARALEKLPADRFGSAEDFGRALREPGATEAWRAARSATGGAASPPTGERSAALLRRFLWPGVAAVLAVIAMVGWLDRGQTPMGVTRLVLPTPDEAGETSGAPLFVTLSPDGRAALYMREGVSGGLGLFLRDLGSEVARRVFDAQVLDAAFSPGGDRIVIHDGANLHVVGRDGGGATLLAAGVSAISLVRWSADDWIYYNDADGALRRIRADGRSSETIAVDAEVEPLIVLAPLSRANAAVVLSPGDQSIGYLRLDSGAYTRLHAGVVGWVVDDRYLVWLDDGAVFGQRFDPATGATEGPAVDLLDGARVALAIGVPLVSVSTSGTLLYVPAGGELGDNLVDISREGVRETLGISLDSDLGLTVSPDGGRITFEERSTNRGDIYVADLASGLRTRLTFDADAVYPTWSTDGRRVAYYRVVDGEYGLYWRPADGSGVEEVLLNGPGREIEVRFFPDGERILVRQGDRSTADGTDLYVYRIGEPDSGRPIADGPGNEVAPRLSPDGRYVAYSTDELAGVQHVFVRSIEDPRERWQITEARGGGEPLWSRDGREVFYRTQGALMAVPVEIQPSFRRLGEPVELFRTTALISNPNHTAYDLAPGSGGFLFIEAPSGQTARIVMGWIEELRQRLGS